MKGNLIVNHIFKVGISRFSLKAQLRDDNFEESKDSLDQNEIKMDTVKIFKIANKYESFYPKKTEEKKGKAEDSEHSGTKHSTEKSEEDDEDEEDEEDDTNGTEIPEGIQKDEIEDPDVQRNLACLLYCTEKHKEYEKIVNDALKKKEIIPDEARKKFLLFQQQKIGIESAIQNEQVTFEQYMEFLNKSLKHDKILHKYFMKIKDEEKAELVKFRMECTEKEINQEVDDASEDE